MIKLRVLLVAVTIALLGGLFLKPATKAYADDPDVLGSYIITIVPQQDGMLVMNYQLKNYCTYSDWPTDKPYLQIAVPNPNFTVNNDWGPKEGTNGIAKVTNAESITDGGTFVQLDFDPASLPKNKDCFNLNFSIVQGKMAHPDPQNGNITFAYYAGSWDFDIQVKTLTINWAFPKDPTLVKVTDPAPTAKDAVNMTWTWNNPDKDSANTYSSNEVKLAYDKSAFTLSDAATTDSSSANGVSVPDFATICIWIIVIVIILFLFCMIIGAIGRMIDTGQGFGTAFVSVIGDTAGALTSGGGEGGSSGNSSGCAGCASCACACACAGGGKVGCMLKTLGIKVGCLQKVVTEMTKPEEKKE